MQWPVSEGGNGHFYEHVYPQRTPSITWTEARDEAAARTFMGVAGHLATVTSEAERTYLFDQFSIVRPSSSQLWIGGVQAPGVTTPTAGWAWVTGEPWDYTAWVAGEPNDWAGNEQYLSMLTYLQGGSVAGAWNDNFDRGVPSAYLVEYPVVPEPGSAAFMVLAAGVLLTRRSARRRWVPTPAVACVLAALAALAVARPARAAPVQWPVSEGGNGHYYDYVLRTASFGWTEARDEAAAASFMGVAGHLATITSDAESQFLGSRFRFPTFQVWAGGVQAPGAATPASGWSWVTAEPWDFTSWNTGEPNDWPTQNVENGEEQYLSVTTYFGGGRGATAWNDNSLRAVPVGYVVEYPVPEPTSAAFMGFAAGVLLTRRPRRE